jgi:1-acyl-sn-glycerol-3-phosphate acyltransferase
LIFAKHPAMRSLAEVTIIGMFSVVMMAYLIPPLVFRWLTQNKAGFREMPVTIKRLLFSVYAFIIFLMGSLLITFVGFTLFVCGKKTRRKEQFYHALLCRIALFVVTRIPGVKFNYENLSDETFEKPAVIISNHQSHLDLMCLMMLTPHLIILTNNRVWNNPFYGRLIRYADFYPVSNGIEHKVEQLSLLVKKGYSIVVFPEGTRSENSSILRFHRGAFYLAERLQLDILPVLLHGVGHVLPKKDFMLREGEITVQVHPRIIPEDLRYAADYPIRTRQVKQYYSRQFAVLSGQRETTAYFYRFVLHNYFYKGVEVERQVRKMLKKTQAWSQWIDTYEGHGPVLVVNNGYGVFAFLFALVHKQVQVTAIDRNEEWLVFAGSCTGIPRNLTIYEVSQLRDTDFDTIYLFNPDNDQRVAYQQYHAQIIEIYG